MKMRHDKLLKRDDGAHYKITVSFYLSHNTPIWGVAVLRKEKGKRTWINIDESNSWQCRRLPMVEREKFTLEKILDHVTAEEILSAKLELWEKLKPVVKS
jgi:hypothetical protein